MNVETAYKKLHRNIAQLPFQSNLDHKGLHHVSNHPH